MSYAATMLADSFSPDGHRLSTMQVTFPRFVLAEFNTHRVFSRNSASSRAIPFGKQLESLLADPFVPDEFGAKQSGMQPGAMIPEDLHDEAINVWVKARDNAIDSANELDTLGVHKSYVNRLLEPFMWHTVIVTATEWDNFFALRCHPAAQREIRIIAEMMRDAYNESLPWLVNYGDWHMPYVLDGERNRYDVATLKKMSVARCTRVSYMTHGTDKIDVAKDLALCDRLAKLGHMSPFEHVARPLARRSPAYARSGNFRGWRQFRKEIPHESNFAEVDA